MTKAVLFDVDGTLIDTVDLHAKAWVEALQPAWCRDRLVGAEELSGVGERPFRPLLPVDPERAFQAQPAPSSPYSAPAA
jgi:beta-phosphoglucomutase-like phosphatase (HAD superfamily)